MDEKRKVLVAGIGFIVLVAAIVVVYLVFFQQRKEAALGETEPVEQTTAPVEPEAEPAESPQAEEPIELDLDQSDEQIRELVQALSSDPTLADWLLGDDLVRRFVAAVDNVAQGQSPRAHLQFLRIPDDFAVQEKDGALVLDPSSYVRYSKVAGVVAGLDSEGVVRLYRRLKPVFQKAYTDLGYPDQDFHATFLRALDELLAVPVVKGDIILEEKLRSFELADPRLEEMSQAQKHLFRMGPDHVQRIKNILTEIKVRLAGS